jgi:hypothetical protein
MAKPKVLFTDTEIKLIETLLEIGYTDQQIADQLGLVRQTFRNRAKQSGVNLHQKKEVADTKVVATLYKKATGYEIQDQVVAGSGADAKILTLTRYQPAELGAIVFWLCNRQGKLWKNVSRTEHTGEGGGPIETKDRIAEELARKLRGQLAKEKDQALRQAHQRH